VATCPIDFGAMRAAVNRIAVRWGLDLTRLPVRGVVEQIEQAAATLTEGGERFREEAHRAVVEIELEAAPAARLLPGAAEALAALRQEGLAVALITRNCRAAAEAVLRDLTDYDVLLARDDVPHLKPDPDHVHRSLAAVHCTAQSAAMVGDHDFDMQAGRAAGVQVCIGVRTGSSSDSSLLAAGADLVLDSLADLPEWLRERQEEAR
jgi:phosphoglycolate phosphatase